MSLLDQNLSCLIYYSNCNHYEHLCQISRQFICIFLEIQRVKNQHMMVLIVFCLLQFATYVRFELFLQMCGPIETCCCCFPAKVGINFIGGILIFVEIGGLIYSTVILRINNKVKQKFSVFLYFSLRRPSAIPLLFQSFHEVSDHDLPGYSWYMAGAILGFIIFLLCNVLLMYGSSKNNR